MSTIRTIAAAVLLLIAIFLATGCRENAEPVTPVDTPTSPLDTTSQDFVWEFDTIATELSFINSVAAISPTDIWATGQFFINDSAGEWHAKPYGNAAHWNGKTWTFHGFNSAGNKSWYELHDAYCRGSDNVWICGGGPFQWDGAKWTTHRYTNNEIFGGGIMETYSTEGAEYVCVVAHNGSIAYYRKDDGVFTKVRIPEDQDCFDVVGREDGTMYVCSGNEMYGYIYKVTPDRKAEIEWTVGSGEPRVLWFKDDVLHFARQRALYRCDRREGQQDATLVFYADYNVYEEDHETENNMFFMQGFGQLLHWNGSTWKQIVIPYPETLWLCDIDVTGKHIYLVGYATGQYCVLAHARQL